MAVLRLSYLGRLIEAILWMMNASLVVSSEDLLLDWVAEVRHRGDGLAFAGASVPPVCVKQMSDQQ